MYGAGAVLNDLPSSSACTVIPKHTIETTIIAKTHVALIASLYFSTLLKLNTVLIYFEVLTQVFIGSMPARIAYLGTLIYINFLSV